MVTLNSDDDFKGDPQKIESIIINCEKLSDETYQLISECINVHSIKMKYHHQLFNLHKYTKLEKYVTKKISFEEVDILHTLPKIHMYQYIIQLPLPLIFGPCEYCECIPCEGHMIIYHKYPFDFNIDDYPKYQNTFLVCDHDFDVNLIEKCTKLKKEYCNIIYSHCPDYMISKLKRVNQSFNC